MADERRFAFGRNWRSFLELVDEERIRQARTALAAMLPTAVLDGLDFLDVGCGSGLFSLAALRMGARRVHSFDFDPGAVGCALELKRRFASGADHWTMEVGDVLDVAYLDVLGEWDVVHAWGVLHHTGDLWGGLVNVARLVRGPGGVLYVAVYNDQGLRSHLWTGVKRLYNRSRAAGWAVTGAVVPLWLLRDLLADLARGADPFCRYREYGRSRGMSLVHDWNDWLGGYPFEVARPADLVRHFATRGFRLVNQRLCPGEHGNNELIFERDGGPHPRGRGRPVTGTR